MPKYRAKTIIRDKIYGLDSKLLDDKGLKALDGFFETDYEIIEAESIPAAEKLLVDRYLQLAKFSAYNAQVIFDESFKEKH